jgi:hypothetical protein
MMETLQAKTSAVEDQTMKTNRKPDTKKSEDSEAILNRRKFLIQAALAGAVLTGCKREAPQACLTPAPPAANPSKAGPCLDIVAPKPQVCLQTNVPVQTNPPTPKVCLSIVAPKPPTPPTPPK